MPADILAELMQDPDFQDFFQDVSTSMAGRGLYEGMKAFLLWPFRRRRGGVLEEPVIDDERLAAFQGEWQGTLKQVGRPQSDFAMTLVLKTDGSFAGLAHSGGEKYVLQGTPWDSDYLTLQFVHVNPQVRNFATSLFKLRPDAEEVSAAWAACSLTDGKVVHGTVVATKVAD